MNWFTLRVISGKEKKVRDNLLFELDYQNLSEEVENILVPSENIVEMKDGKKSTAENIVYQALDTVISTLGQTSDTTPQVFEDILDKVKPVVEVRSRRVGGATYQIPVEVRQERREALAMRWLIESARSRSEKSMKVKLANELLDASNDRGNAIKKKEDTHKMAEANKAFSHFRW